MSPVEFQRLEELFHDLSPLPTGEREARLAALPEPDSAILAELRRMLAEGDVEDRPRPAEPFQPRRFGPYTTTRLLGQGGMGSVFHARRDDGQFEQEVAIKVVAPHLTGPATLERFLSERRIVAELAHPNITRLLDGGVTGDGAPYLVMEFVEGEPVDVFSDSRKLTVEERVRLFLQVCDAVAFAHRQLIVHRDIKPGNILVDAAGNAKLLDFGAAKLLGMDAANLTQTGAAIMTPRYASPEQARGQQVGAQSDIYSLGVLLYELSSATGPFGDAAGPMAEYLRIAENRSAEPLGVHLGANAAENRGVPEPALRRKLAGDLRQILAKCLRHDPEERYRSVDALRADLEAWLSNRPVAARPLTFTYQSRKFAQRHSWKLAAAAIALGAILWQGWIARVERDRALRRFDEVRDLARLVLFDFHDEIGKIPGSMAVRKTLIDRTLTRFEALARESNGDPELLAELAEGQSRLGDILENPYQPTLGEVDKAIAVYRKALEMLDAVPARTAPEAVTQARIKLLRNVGRTLWAKGERAEAEKQLARAVALLDSADPARKGSLDLMLEALAVRTTLGDFFIETDAAQGLVVFERAVVDLEAIKKADPEGKRQISNGVLQYKIGACRETTGDMPGAIRAYRAGLEENDKLSPAQRGDPRNLRARASLLNTLAMGLASTASPAEALAPANEAVGISRKLAEADPANARAKLSLAVNLNGRNSVLERGGDYHALLAAQIEEQSAWRSLLAATDQPGYRSNAATNKDSLSRTYAKLGDSAKASEYCGAALREFDRLTARDPAVEDLRRHASALLECGAPELRDPARALRLVESAVRPGKPAEMLVRTHAAALRALGREAEAAALEQ